MIQYKLIKVYPEHTLGEIHCADKSTKWYGTIFYDAYPEFWKKVEEVDYEILTVTPSEKNLNNTNKEAVITFKMCNKDLQMWNIHSVKRLSDGEVFTIGDTIANMCNSEQKIKELYINKEGKMCVYTSTTCRFTIGNIKKVKTPLFTTEDGVDIFEGDKFCLVQISTLTILEKGRYKPNMKDWICFSTKEKAEEYILLNKPCLSVNEIIAVIPVFKFHKEILIAKAKSKL